MCSKRVTTLSVGNGMSSVSVHRDCAIQSLGQEQIQLNGKWHRETVIHEVHEEGCDEDSNDLERLTKTLNCHCRGNYCNGSIANVINFKTILLTILIYIFKFS
ncbi:jg9538 [Pararge aegeria aegeria]|uniref:Jg9538 protein n=2 Tax=Pararge aegeria TaxID=116150 RepID=A0A8S4RII5_9NEOP|nr:jg9538 [Pararge aegeria aegeria]